MAKSAPTAAAQHIGNDVEESLGFMRPISTLEDRYYQPTMRAQLSTWEEREVIEDFYAEAVAA